MKNTPVSDVMTVNPQSVSPSQPLLDVKHLYEKKDFHHHIPVIEGEKLVGMISLLDFMYGIKGAGIDDSSPIYSEKLVKDIMSTNLMTLDDQASLHEAAELFTSGEFHSIPIVSGERLVGIITTTDLIRHLINTSN
ncbi:MAG: CBS domain-containing protein [Flavobacteriales bacterium]|nr:CBS domain-containing protein [Flavobacteriales bacterium]NNK81140.1 CBS domain-containing protein [Flavobacteriales bacterium]